MGGLVVAALGVVLILLAYKGPGSWAAAWAVLVQQGGKATP
jgi:hypothetical protein